MIECYACLDRFLEKKGKRKFWIFRIIIKGDLCEQSIFYLNCVSIPCILQVGKMGESI
jgi:hypothetical protein